MPDNKSCRAVSDNTDRFHRMKVLVSNKELIERQQRSVADRLFIDEGDLIHRYLGQSKALTPRDVSAVGRGVSVPIDS